MFNYLTQMGKIPTIKQYTCILGTCLCCYAFDAYAFLHLNFDSFVSMVPQNWGFNQQCMEKGW